MRLIIDGNETVLTGVSPQDRKKFAAAVQQEVSKKKAFIDQVYCDDAAIDDLHGFLSGSVDVSRIGQLRIITKPAQSVCNEALQELQVRLPASIKMLQGICQSLRQDKVAEAVEWFVKMLPFYNMLVMGMVSIQQQTKNDYNFNPQQMALVLKEMSQALNDADYARFCDSVEYQLIPQLQNLEGAFKRDRTAAQ